jgi:hypothetical protein
MFAQIAVRGYRPQSRRSTGAGGTPPRSGIVSAAKTTPLDIFTYGVVDAGTGALLWEQPKSPTILSDPLQTPTMVLMDHKAMQGNLTGLGRIGRAAYSSLPNFMTSRFQ